MLLVKSFVDGVLLVRDDRLLRVLLVPPDCGPRATDSGLRQPRGRSHDIEGDILYTIFHAPSETVTSLLRREAAVSTLGVAAPRRTQNIAHPTPQTPEKSRTHVKSILV